jgi:hypothetical protein
MLPADVQMPVHSKMFAEKAARSVAELQYGVNSVADVVVFLEILGYDDNSAAKNGFANLMELAKHVYPFLDHYENPKDVPQWSYIEDPSPGRRQRLTEALAMYAPWLGALVMLNVTGFSLWMAQVLPADITVAFVLGIFAGLVLTEWPMQTYSRMFFMYYEQRNVGEVKRSIKRGYALAAIILSCFSVAAFVTAAVTNIPLDLAYITIGASVAVAVHRLSFNIVYLLKKMRVVFVAYTLAFSLLAGTFYLLPQIADTEVTVRYFASLAAAFIVLTAFAAYYHAKLPLGSKPRARGASVPEFYRHPSTTAKTLQSRYKVQLWESLPFSVYGTFYFVMLFGDRFLSWIFSPYAIIASNGTFLPMMFNPEYHVGADVALLALVPVIIVQYVIMAPVYMLIHNNSLKLKVSEIANMDSTIKKIYRNLIIFSLTASLASVAILHNLGPEIISVFRGSELSFEVMRYASIGSISVSLFTANAVTMMLLNRARMPALLTLAGGVMVMVSGFMLAPYGTENLALAYLGSTTAVAVASFVLVLRMLRGTPATDLIARY